MKTSEKIEKLLKDEHVLYLYQFPYRDLYGIDTDRVKYTMIVDDVYRTLEVLNEVIESFTVFRKDYWFEQVLEGKIKAWECACLKKKYILKEYVKLLLTTDPVGLRLQIESLKQDVYKSKNKGLCLNLLKQINFANQIIENHKIVNYNVLGDAYDAINAAEADKVLEVFGNYFTPQYELLKKYTDGPLLKYKQNELQRNKKCD